MGKQTVFGLGAVLLLAVLNSALADKIYFKDGGSVTLELRPPFSGAITEILWKFNRDLVAEWIDGYVPLTFYGMFKGRSTLDTTTGRLEIRNMSKADAGLYTVEINSRVQDQRFDAEEMEVQPMIAPTPFPTKDGTESSRTRWIVAGSIIGTVIAGGVTALGIWASNRESVSEHRGTRSTDTAAKN